MERTCWIQTKLIIGHFHPQTWKRIAQSHEYLWYSTSSILEKKLATTSNRIRYYNVYALTFKSTKMTDNNVSLFLRHDDEYNVVRLKVAIPLSNESWLFHYIIRTGQGKSGDKMIRNWWHLLWTKCSDGIKRDEHIYIYIYI